MRRLVPTVGEGIDAAVVFGLGLLALLGFGNTFEGSAYLFVGAVALVIGILLAHVTTASRQPVVVLAAATLLGYFLFAPPLVFPTDPWLSLDTLRQVADGAVLSWKQLLTTTPPVEPGSPLLVVPFILGLLIGAGGFGSAQRLARRSTPGSVLALVRAGTPALVPAVALGVVLALGTNKPAARFLDGVVFAGVALVWVSARLRRLRPPTRGTTRPVRRVVTGAGVVGAAAVASMLVAPWMPGVENPRIVLRDFIVPPFDLSAYPSPLVGFRKFTQDANKLWDQELFRVSGLPEGATVRIATLNDYDGTVWGATDEAGFRPVSARIMAEPPGPVSTIQVEILDAYAVSPELNAWVPEAGVVSRVEFSGDRSRELGASLHYNRDLSAGIVTARLRAGDTYTIETTFTDTSLPEHLQSYGLPYLTDNAQAMLSRPVADWTAAAGTDPGARLLQLAEHLRTNGAYTNGGAGFTHYLPGHSVGRLTAFVAEKKPAGDDEQYAALFALAANHLGIPARVVLGARPDASGVVRGEHVHAWVEVHVADGRWVPIPETLFMPDKSQKPEQDPPKNFENPETPIVPPPNAGRLPTTSTDTSRVDPVPQEGEQKSFWEAVLAALIVVAAWAGPPLVVVLLVIATILGLKRRRRKRRLRRGLPANRYAGAWLELADQVRDLAQVRPELRHPSVMFAPGTRREHATVLESTGVLAPGVFLELADRVDRVVYGEADPRTADARAFWSEVNKQRHALTRGLTLRQRWRVALSIRSLRIADLTRDIRPNPHVNIRSTPTIADIALAGGRRR